MAANQIRTLLQFVNLQIGAEALFGFDPRAPNGGDCGSRPRSDSFR